MADASAPPTPLLSPALAASAARIAALRARRRVWFWAVILSGVASLVLLIGTFALSLHHFRAAMAVLPDDGAVDAALPSQPPRFSADVLRSHTGAAVGTLGTGLSLFVVGTIVFLCAVSCYISTRAQIIEAEKNALNAENLAAELVTEADIAREAAADEAIARQLGLGPYAAQIPVNPPPAADAARFQAILEGKSDSAAEGATPPAPPPADAP
ncbi:hypothetical protein DB346_17700 [Verrucomicrobia bacterium LW23]|nr:hypothetical protein DB346_17700 [Verrucomicrobia bacterium LW23]